MLKKSTLYFDLYVDPLVTIVYWLELVAVVGVVVATAVVGDEVVSIDGRGRCFLALIKFTYISSFLLFSHFIISHTIALIRSLLHIWLPALPDVFLQMQILSDAEHCEVELRLLLNQRPVEW